MHCLNFPRFACPTPYPSSCALAGRPPEGHIPPLGFLPLTVNSWQELELTAVAEAVSLHPSSGSWLVLFIRHKRGSLLPLSFLNPRENLFCPWNGQLVREASCHSAPCPRPRPAARWTTARWPSIQASESRRSGKTEGWKRRAGGGWQEGYPVVFCRREGSFRAQSPSSPLQPNPLPRLSSNFPSPWPGWSTLTGTQAERHGPSDILSSFSFSFSSPLLPSVYRGVSAESSVSYCT